MDSSAEKESTIINQVRRRWLIDLEWFQRSNRSFTTLAEGCLCPKCRKQMEGKAVAAEELLANIRDCCSKDADFITPETPILESVFRLFLANGNQPLALEELERQLKERRGDDYRITAGVLSRLLSADQYYGLSEVPE